MSMKETIRLWSWRRLKCHMYHDCVSHTVLLDVKAGHGGRFSIMNRWPAPHWFQRLTWGFRWNDGTWGYVRSKWRLFDA